jgi:hypothetical protein
VRHWTAPCTTPLGLGRGGATTQDGASLVLGFGMESRWDSGGSAAERRASQDGASLVLGIGMESSWDSGLTTSTMMSVMYGIERAPSGEGRRIQPRWGLGRGGATTQDGASLVLGFGIESRWDSGMTPRLDRRCRLGGWAGELARRRVRRQPGWIVGRSVELRPRILNPNGVSFRSPGQAKRRPGS